MGTNCAPLLVDIFLYSYEAEFIQSLISAGRKQLASRFNFTYRYMYIDDVLSINNPEFENYLGQIYPVELDIKDTTERNTSASYLDLVFVTGLSKISSFFSYYQHLFPAALWSVVTRFPASGCFKCHYYLIRVLTLFCARFPYTTESLPHFYRIIKILDCSVSVGVFVTGLSKISSFFSYFCPSGGTVNFTLPLMTNVTISIFISQIFRP